jgi:hypothetical protein
MQVTLTTKFASVSWTLKSKSVHHFAEINLPLQGILQSEVAATLPPFKTLSAQHSCPLTEFQISKVVHHYMKIVAYYSNPQYL